MGWLNESTAEGNAFYLVTIEAVRIGDSAAAPLFQIVCSPSAEVKLAEKEKGELAQRHVQRREFWLELLDKSKVRTALFSNVSPSTENWIAAGAGRTGMVYNYIINMDSAHVELYIDKGKESEDINAKRFEHLSTKKDAIEKTFGDSLEWVASEGRRSTLIHKKVSDYGLRDVERRDEVQNAMVDAMVRLEASLKPHIPELEV